ncbi:hypothetical protein L226DRAFT_184876 [Lentinus tigrinus ALCF2SS1-7]|uniref:uncharacterized protein n=1 Tax=Lentinus tigrinus ALCF2SS1-7 TaxID=1328758 RepID=UPI001165EB01|nr:hypothetical protein L226DRAFT_184876 [Lentinus tigrinus ALCF2SS1-7]
MCEATIASSHIMTTFPSWLRGEQHITPLTWQNVALAHAYLPLYFFLAYLTRRPRTHRLRIFLLPVVVAVILRCTLRYRIMEETWGWYNWMRGLLALTLIAHSIYFASLPEGMLKLSEEPPRICRGSPAESSVVWSPEKDEGQMVAAPAPSLTPGGVLRCISDALEVGLLGRGIGWRYSQGLHIPKHRRSTERKAFLKSTSLSVIAVFLLIDLVDSSVEYLPGITATSGTLFLPHLPPILRYTVSTALTFVIGMVVILGISMWYDLMSLIAVGIFHQSPSDWPPFHDEPWKMGSLHEFWSKRWHQVLRHTFLVMGGYPGRWLGGDVGMLFGTFLASGLFHEFGFNLGGAPFDWKVIAYFAVQPFGLLAEKTYRAYTGRRVSGWLGWCWAAMWVVGLNQMASDSWFARGAAGKVLVPPALSPARRVFIPIARDMWNTYVQEH